MNASKQTRKKEKGFVSQIFLMCPGCYDVDREQLSWLAFLADE